MHMFPAGVAKIGAGGLFLETRWCQLDRRQADRHSDWEMVGTKRDSQLGPPRKGQGPELLLWLAGGLWEVLLSLGGDRCAWLPLTGTADRCCTVWPLSDLGVKLITCQGRT